ncbi:hypothetical protein EF294_17995 [Gordonia oryzae]|uniref:Uncharacterized protein n=1 Tax=Gordonia oryzae TaxID=2487349 RepID=A0A3N4G470_9ACTN|nr:DUF6764 family protein [Gordonia oryzae]RPA57702.1 hypothetical protein EF294_17995 [Gordonia oryzae]
MRSHRFAARALIVAVGGAGAIWGLGLGGGGAQAVICNATNGHEVQQIRGTSGCGARAGVGSSASAQETGGGTAVAVSDRGGNANAINQAPGSSALAGATTNGTSYSITTGPKALAVAQARVGGYSVAIGGWGGQAYSGQPGVACSGGFAAAADTTSGKACLKYGSIDLHN